MSFISGSGARVTAKLTDSLFMRTSSKQADCIEKIWNIRAGNTFEALSYMEDRGTVITNNYLNADIASFFLYDLMLHLTHTTIIVCPKIFK